MLRAKEAIREELQGMHAKELKTRDEFITLLQLSVSELERKLSDKGHGATLKSAMTAGAGTLGGRSSGESMAKGDNPTVEPSSSESRPSVRKFVLPSLPKFSGIRTMMLSNSGSKR